MSAHRFPPGFCLSRNLIQEECLDKNHREVLRSQQDQIRGLRREAISILSRTLCHEINNPLTSVVGYSERLLRMKELPYEVRQEISIIHENALQIQESVRHIVSLKGEKVKKMGKISLMDLQEVSGIE